MATRQWSVQKHRVFDMLLAGWRLRADYSSWERDVTVDGYTFKDTAGICYPNRKRQAVERMIYDGWLVRTDDGNLKITDAGHQLLAEWKKKFEKS